MCSRESAHGWSSYALLWSSYEFLDRFTNWANLTTIATVHTARIVVPVPFNTACLLERCVH